MIDGRGHRNERLPAVGSSCGRPHARLWFRSSLRHFLFQRTPSLRVFEDYTQCRSNSLPESDRSARKSRFFLACVSLGDQRLHLRVGKSDFCCARAAARRKCSRISSSRSSAAATFPARNSPASMAVLASRTYSNSRGQRLGRVQIVVQALFELRRAAAVRFSAISSFDALGRNLSVSRRSLKLRRRSMAVAAAFNPSNVKFNFLRYGTDASRYRMVSGAYPCSSRVAQRVEIPSRLRHLLRFHVQKFRMQPEARERLVT